MTGQVVRGERPALGASALKEDWVLISASALLAALTRSATFLVTASVSVFTSTVTASSTFLAVNVTPGRTLLKVLVPEVTS